MTNPNLEGGKQKPNIPQRIALAGAGLAIAAGTLGLAVLPTEARPIVRPQSQEQIAKNRAESLRKFENIRNIYAFADPREIDKRKSSEIRKDLIFMQQIRPQFLGYDDEFQLQIINNSIREAFTWYYNSIKTQSVNDFLQNPNVAPIHKPLWNDLNSANKELQNAWITFSQATGKPQRDTAETLLYNALTRMESLVRIAQQAGMNNPGSL